jgi:uncharacterized membrane protein YccC
VRAWTGFGAAPQPWPEWLRLLARLAIGAGLAALIVTLAGFPLEPAAWSVVAVAVVVGDTTGQALNASWNRVQGSIVGCLSGATVAVALPMLPVFAKVMLAVALALFACRLLRVGAGWRLGVALAGFFIFVPGAEEWETVGWRLGATILGITVGLIAVVGIAPDSAASRLSRGIRAALVQIADGVDAAVAGWAGDAPAAAPAPPRVAALRSLVADRRIEMDRGGPDAVAFTRVLDGLEVASAGLARLHRHAAADGGIGVHALISGDVRQVAGRIRSACEAMADSLDGRPAAAMQVDRCAKALAAVDADLAQSIERLRAAGVTPGAGAAELVRLFGVMNALGVIAEGLASAAHPLGATVTA